MRGGFATFEIRAAGSTCLKRVLSAMILSCCVSAPGCSDRAGDSQRSPVVPPRESASETDEVSSTDSPDIRRRYEGLTLDEWRVRLKSLGPGVAGVEDAIPGLRAIAEDQSVEPAIRNQVVMLLGRLGKPGLVALPTLEKVLMERPGNGIVPAVWSAKAISLLGPEARKTAPRLIEVLENPETPLVAQTACLEALAQIGGHHAQAIPAVVRTLNRSAEADAKTNDRHLLMASVDAISLLGPAASVAVPQLMRLLDHPHELVRMKVVQALRAVGTASSPAAASLAEMLIFDDSDAVRREAAFALAAIGPEGHTLLLNLVGDQETFVRTLATEGIGTIAPRSNKVERRLRQALGDAEPAVRLAAAIALQNDPSHREDVLRAFSQLITERDRSIRLSAANQLTAMTLDEAEWEKLRLKIEDRLNDESRRLWERIQRKREMIDGEPEQKIRHHPI